MCYLVLPVDSNQSRRVTQAGAQKLQTGALYPEALGAYRTPALCSRGRGDLGTAGKAGDVFGRRRLEAAEHPAMAAPPQNQPAPEQQSGG